MPSSPPGGLDVLHMFIAHSQNLPVQILIRGKRFRSASSGSVVYSVPDSENLRTILVVYLTGIQARRVFNRDTGASCI